MSVDLDPEDSMRAAALAQHLDEALEDIRDEVEQLSSLEDRAEARTQLAGLLETLMALLFPQRATRIDPYWSLRIPPGLVDRLREGDEVPRRQYWRELPRVTRALAAGGGELQARDVNVLEKVVQAVDQEVSGDLSRSSRI